MEKSNLVSVIIPCYNQACYLEECIRSVIKSTYKNLEIIIINDGSTDCTDKISQKLQVEIPSIHYYYQENRGPSAARNFGIRKSTGSIILPLDSDDIISENYIQEAVKVLEKNPEIKVVYCEAEKFGEQTGKWCLPDFTLDKLVRRNLIFTSALFRKHDWERIGGYDEHMTWALEDWDFWISMLKNGGGVYRLPFVGFYYRIRKNSRTENARNGGLELTINYFNEKHKEFIYKKLGGPLRRRKKMSRFINFITGTTFSLYLSNMRQQFFAEESKVRQY
ncbi:MAG: glycosyltransferase family 2 protein [Prolixibacteraceae bacterium]|nr:glycosyltransferase family 2 protein [Prolixibacteraceae bacterium]